MREMMTFNSSLGVRLQPKHVVQEIKRFIEESEKHKYKVIIGTDSELLQNKTADFVTAVVIHRVGNGGRYFWRRAQAGKFYTLRDRIINEVVLSLEVAREILLELKDAGVTNWDFEIHADVGDTGPTKALIQEVVGMIRASNFEAKTKPESYAASKVADRHV